MRNSVKNLLPKRFSLKALDILVGILAIVALSYEINEYFPSETVIVLELAELEEPFTYSLTGADSDQNYLLEYVKIYPYSDFPIKQATFKYDHYIKEVDLQISKKEQPQGYFISKEFLQTEFAEPSFQFEFLDNNRLIFNFQFDSGDKPHFECKVMVIDKSIPCKVVQESWISSWFYTIGLSVFIVLVVFFWLFIRMFIWKETKEYGYNKGRGYG